MYCRCGGQVFESQIRMSGWWWDRSWKGQWRVQSHISEVKKQQLRSGIAICKSEWGFGCISIDRRDACMYVLRVSGSMSRVYMYRWEGKFLEMEGRSDGVIWEDAAYRARSLGVGGLRD